jgi:hypothetical protein
MMIEFGIEWAFNQLDEFKIINNLTTPKPKTQAEYVSTLLEQCWHFVQKNGVVLIPFTECYWDDTCALDFSAKLL